MAHSIGATPLTDGRCAFRVWAPARASVAVRLLEDGRTVPLLPTERGWYEAVVDDVAPGARYFLVLDGELERPDPASRFQPDGVHGASAVVTRDFAWTDAGWRGIPLHDLVFYELHVGTFTPEGTFDGVTPHLRRLREELGVTSVELLPIAQFPGGRNWGYDGVLPYAVQNSYGGPDGLRRLVDAAHAVGMAVTLDVVYNHLGPEGNHLSGFGPYFTSVYKTPWGDALNYDDAGSDEVRRYFLDNARHWFEEYHIDALRLDAVHAILDRGAKHLLQQLAEETSELSARLGRPLHLIAESDLNDTRLIRPIADGGLGLDAQWTDDFHHAMHARVTGEREGYYSDYDSLDRLVRTLRLGWSWTGDYSAYRKRVHGNDPSGIPPERLVVAIQNHDQVGNRMRGDRLGRVVDFEALKAVAAANLLSPFLPLLFMGEEYDEEAPFPYFVSHGDADLVTSVREGRRREFQSFAWAGDPPDPQSEETFASAKLDHALRERGHHAQLYALYSELARVRADMSERRAERDVALHGQVISLRRRSAEGESLLILSLAEGGSAEAAGNRAEVAVSDGPWLRALDTAEERWAGPGSRVPGIIDAGATLHLHPWQAVLLRRG